jgi:hypothetical protein
MTGLASQFATGVTTTGIGGSALIALMIVCEIVDAGGLTASTPPVAVVIRRAWPAFPCSDAAHGGG